MERAAGIAYRRIGSGPPLVLLHGTGGSHEVWDPVVELVRHERETFVLDLPGCGESPPLAATRAASNAAFADRVVAFVDELRLERPHVGGTSLGAHVALLVGARGAARSVVAFSPTGFFTAGEARYLNLLVRSLRVAGALSQPLAPWLAQRAWGRSVLLGTSYAAPAGVPPAAALATVTALVRSTGFGAMMRGANGEVLGGGRPSTADAAAAPDPELVRRLAQIPVTIGWAEKDRFLGVRQAERARRALPFARHEILRGCGHLATWDDPGALASLLVEVDQPSPMSTARRSP